VHRTFRPCRRTREACDAGISIQEPCSRAFTNCTREIYALRYDRRDGKERTLQRNQKAPGGTCPTLIKIFATATAGEASFLMLGLVMHGWPRNIS